MKKLLLVLAIGAFAACNNASQEAAAPAADTTAVAAPAAVDTTAAAAPAADTTTAK
ncbi:MAG: hypothetical protein RL732_1484 [Bacteroidota bacterium]|jgi:hypothetical protein